MSSAILESVITITQQRDSESLEFSLIATLADLIDVREITLLRQFHDIYDGNLERIVHLRISTNGQDKNDIYWEQQPSRVSGNTFIEQSLKHNKVIVTFLQANVFYHYFSINIGNKTTSLL